MKPIRIRFINQATGCEDFLDGYPTATPGLVVHQSAVPCSDGRCFMVTHARSGCLVSSRCFHSPEGALPFAEALGAVADWTQDGETLRAVVTPDVRETIPGLALRYGGLLHEALTLPASKLCDNGVIA